MLFTRQSKVIVILFLQIILASIAVRDVRAIEQHTADDDRSSNSKNLPTVALQNARNTLTSPAHSDNYAWSSHDIVGRRVDQTIVSEYDEREGEESSTSQIRDEEIEIEGPVDDLAPGELIEDGRFVLIDKLWSSGYKGLLPSHKNTETAELVLAVKNDLASMCNNSDNSMNLEPGKTENPLQPITKNSLPATQEFIRQKRGFQPLEQVGKGSFGEAWRALDLHSFNEVVLKRLFLEKGKQVLLSGNREIFYGTNHRSSPHISRLIGHFTRGKDLWLVFHHEGFSLVQVLFQPDANGMVVPTPFWWAMRGDPSLRKMKSILYQVVRGLSILHASNVVHRDLKMANILVNRSENPIVRICDLGSAYGSENENLYGPEGPSHLEETEAYSPPETLEGKQNYRRDWTYDMWSVGVVFMEMLLGRRVEELFAPHLNRKRSKKEKATINNGTDAQRRLLAMKDMCLVECTEEKFLEVLHELDFAGGVIDAETSNLLRSLLAWKPEDRLTAAQALQHPWFKDVSPRSKMKTEFYLAEVASQANRGRRRSMEDAVSPFINGVIGVFDGHVGSEVSTLAAATIPKLVAEGMSFGEAFAEFDKMVENETAGTTAVVAKLDGLTLRVANMGDCRAIMGIKTTSPGLTVGTSVEVIKGRWKGRVGKVVEVRSMPMSQSPVYLLDLVRDPSDGMHKKMLQTERHSLAADYLKVSLNITSYRITEDHKPDLPREKARIEALGGFVQDGQVPRVMGKYATSRSLGSNGPLKAFLGDPWQPDIFAAPLNSTVEFVVLGSDGLFGVLSDQDVVEHVHKAMAERGPTEILLSEAMESLVSEAIFRGSTDNIGVSTIHFTWQKSEEEGAK